jgi:hypothetical protein
MTLGTCAAGRLGVEDRSFADTRADGKMAPIPDFRPVAVTP